MKKGVLYTAGSIVILILCLIAFVLPASLGRGGARQKPLEFGKYDGKAITYESGSDFADFVSRYAEMIRGQGGQIDSQTQYSLFSYAFSSTVMKMAYESAVEKSGWKVPKEAINRQLRPYFYDENGNFSSKIYKQSDAASVEQLRNSIEDSLISNRFYDDNFGSTIDIFGKEALYGLKESDAELDFLKAYDAEKRGFNVVSFKKSDFPEEEKLAFANKNTAKFVKYDMSVITVDDKSTADKVAKRLSKGEITFEDAITEYSNKTYSNSEGKLTNTYQYQLENLLNDKGDIDQLAKLANDEVSAVIQTLLGYSIFKVDGAISQPDFTADEMKTRVSSYINSYESTLIEDYFTAKAKEFVATAKSSSFDSACESLGIEKAETTLFPLNYGNASIATRIDGSIAALRDAEENETLLNQAFSVALNGYTDPVVVNDYVVVLQYTTADNTVSEDEITNFAKSINDYDDASAQTAIMEGPKLENNFLNTYYTNLM